MTVIPDAIGVIGGGRMGVGIAHAFLLAGAEVTILERDNGTAEHAAAELRRAVGVSVDRGVTDRSAADLAGDSAVATEPSELAACGLVVEAVPENLELKRSMLRRVEDVLSADSWLATNTSSLSISSISEGLTHPERLVGLHFFNPVPASTLVEIVRGPRTEGELVRLAQGWVDAIGKTPITVLDSPGFASSRLGVVIALEAIRMLEDGVASAEDIDSAMVLGYKYPVGPLRLTDMVGLDVRLGIAEYLSSTLGERFDPPQLLRAKVEAGHLGRKSGQGFFSWAD
ncbi:3-hydroxyacyl-CoA dehydrogenase PaaC [Microbacterium esteraromaticum]|uniref:3-hydroxyacyl-CoA dehydrogenase PaaC n=1 Tax=Microbacterium esteraromaticum TaxID=57043 RepID=A0A1R4KBP6_9MICO|nr:3-hydroxyacyl-CoA dehydrogenase family protein [Microbacterium esteraromaticum]SJN41658.1 3-hydroxyacyl-CoA dehydrogenase PaaC [Microbacterium esteraromaticum]